MSEQSLERLLEAEFATGPVLIGEVLIRQLEGGAFDIAHRKTGVSPAVLFSVEDMLEIAKFDDAGNYRPLKTAPNLRHGWRTIASNLSLLIEVIDVVYPGRLAAWRAWKNARLTTMPLRATLNRQSGMYRVAAKISDVEINDVVGNFCRSDGGCLRTILWRRDKDGTLPSKELPREKFDPAFDQTGRSERCIPLLCQEPCNLLVAACREVVKQ